TGRAKAGHAQHGREARLARRMGPGGRGTISHWVLGNEKGPGIAAFLIAMTQKSCRRAGPAMPCCPSARRSGRLAPLAARIDETKRREKPGYRGMAERQNAFGYEELLAHSRGELPGQMDARLPAPPMLMFDRIT